MGDCVDQLSDGDIGMVQTAIRELAEDFSRTHPGEVRPFAVEFDHRTEDGPKRVHVPASEVIGALAALREGHREPFDALQGRFGNLDFLVDVVLPFAAQSAAYQARVGVLMAKIGYDRAAALRHDAARFGEPVAPGSVGAEINRIYGQPIETQFSLVRVHMEAGGTRYQYIFLASDNSFLRPFAEYAAEMVGSDPGEVIYVQIDNPDYFVKGLHNYLFGLEEVILRTNSNTVVVVLEGLEKLDNLDKRAPRTIHDFVQDAYEQHKEALDQLVFRAGKRKVLVILHLGTSGGARIYQNALQDAVSSRFVGHKFEVVTSPSAKALPASVSRADEPQPLVTRVIDTVGPAPSPPPVATVSAGFNVRSVERPVASVDAGFNVKSAEPPDPDGEESSRVDLTHPDDRERGPTPRGDTVKEPGLRERLISKALEADLREVAEILATLDDSQIERLRKGLRHWRVVLRHRGHGELAKALPGNVSRSDQLLLMVAAISAKSDFNKIVARLLPLASRGLVPNGLPAVGAASLLMARPATVLPIGR